MTDDKSEEYDAGIGVKEEHEPGFKIKDTESSEPDGRRVICTACGAETALEKDGPNKLFYPCNCDAAVEVVHPDGETETVEERLVKDVSDRVVGNESTSAEPDPGTAPPPPEPEPTEAESGSGNFMMGAIIAVVGGVISLSGVLAIIGVPLVFVGLALMFPRLATLMIVLGISSIIVLILMLA